MMTTPQDVLTAMDRIAGACPWGHLVTPGPPLASRVVQHLSVPTDGGVVFSTGPGTRKAEALRGNPSCVYSVLDAATGAAFAMYGDATLSDDPDRCESLWIDDLAPFFPAGPRDPSFVLVEIAATRIEMWSMVDGIAPEPLGLSSAVCVRTEAGWQMADNTYPLG